MFLFPHVLQVVTAAESCKTTVGLAPTDMQSPARTHHLVSASLQARLHHHQRALRRQHGDLLQHLEQGDHPLHALGSRHGCRRAASWRNAKQFDLFGSIINRIDAKRVVFTGFQQAFLAFMQGMAAEATILGLQSRQALGFHR